MKDRKAEKIVGYRLLVGVFACGWLLVLASACGSNGTGSSGSESAGTANGQETVGLVVAGDRNDRGMYQGQAEALAKVSDTKGLKSIVVDNVDPGAAKEAFINLARQKPDLIIGGGQELTDGIAAACESVSDKSISWVLIAPIEPTAPCYSTAKGDENIAHFLGGVAEGLLLEDAQDKTVCMVAGPELSFVKNAADAQQAGLKYQGSEAKVKVSYTGDFEDASLAKEATDSLISKGCGLFYAYLGGALPAALKAANDRGVKLIATSYDQCNSKNPPFAISILYNPAIYLPQIIDGWLADELEAGSLYRLFGVEDGIGATICNGTADENKVMADAAAALGAGKIDLTALMADATGAK